MPTTPAYIVPQREALALAPEQFRAVFDALPIAARALVEHLDTLPAGHPDRGSMLLLADRLDTVQRVLSPAHNAIVRVSE